MTEMVCSYPGDRREVLIAYVYDDITPLERAAFEAHLAACDICQAELSEFGAVRRQLAEWAPPEPGRALTEQGVGASGRKNGIWAALHEVPAWMQVAAAVLVLGVAAGAANLDVRYNADGLAIRTGWSAPAIDGSVAPAGANPSVSTRSTATSTASTSEPAVSKADLLALESRLKGEIEAAPAAPSLRAVRALIADSERKQQNELALRIASVYQDSQTQRTADLVRIQNIFSTLQSSTRTELMRQRDDTLRVSNVVQRLAKNQ